MTRESLESIENAYKNSAKYSLMYKDRAYLNDCIRRGDVESLIRFLDSTEKRNPNFVNLAQGDISYARDMVISHLTYLAEYALEAGIDAAEVEKLNQLFRWQIHKCYSVSELPNISRDMSITYASRIRHHLNIEKKQSYSKLVCQCLNYISDHIFEPLSVEAIAYVHNISTSHLQRRIKEETGNTLKELILRKKIEQAKYLISYTDGTLAEIAHSLHFSSQSHFTACFKRITGLTPLVFRNKRE